MAGQHDDRRLEPVLPHDADGLAAVDIGEPDIHDDQVDLAGLGRLHAFRPAIDRDRLELVVQRQLLDQCFAQLRLVVDNQNLTGVRHGLKPSARAAAERMQIAAHRNPERITERNPIRRE